MKIVFDGTALCDASGRTGAGIEHYTWSMLFALARFAEKDRLLVTVPSTLPQKRETAIRTLDSVDVLRSRGKIPFFSRHMVLPTRLVLKGAQLFFSPHGQLPLGWNGKSVITLHDTSIFGHPEWFPDASNNSFSTKKIVPRSIAKADRIICVSKATRDQAEDRFEDVREKLCVVHEGVWPPEKIYPMGSRFVSLLNGIEDVLLFLGTIEPRKNLLNTLHAFHRFLEVHPERARVTRFILAGSLGWKTKEIEEAIGDVNRVWRLRAGGQIVHQVGYVTEDDKWALLARANALLLLSYEEGFGLPVLEAMSVGTPVIASEIPALREIAGDVAFYAAPEDPETIAQAIAQILLLPEGASQLREAALERAKIFSWEAAAEETWKIIREVAARED